jgi:hypothetical protein
VAVLYTPSKFDSSPRALENYRLTRSCDSRRGTAESGFGTMLQLFHRARWDQAYDFLAAGDPPMIFRILVINTIFVILYVIRKTRGQHKMRMETVIQVQLLLLAANCLILFQRDVQDFIGRFL